MIEKLRNLSLHRLAILDRAAPPALPAPKSPRTRFFDCVDNVAMHDRLPFHMAMAKVKADEPELFRAAFPQPRGARMTREQAPELLAA